jgi:endonuclease YncB( thermonuclease family)
MTWPRIAVGSALLGAAAIAAAGSFDPGSGFASAGIRLARASFEGPVNADVVHVVDGDTFEARAAIWLGQSIEVRVRIAGVDAPELRARCDAERIRAEAARDWLVRRIEGAEVRLSEVHYDKYGGRVDATVRDGTGDVGAALLASGLARPYHGGRRGRLVRGGLGRRHRFCHLAQTRPERTYDLRKRRFSCGISA